MSRADDNGPFKEFTFDDWIRQGFEGFQKEFQGGFEEFRKQFDQNFEEFQAEFKSAKNQFDMPEFRQHLRNASREQLLAMRSLIDKALEYLDRQEERHQA